jgi:three-Cys-motif partner protein
MSRRVQHFGGGHTELKLDVVAGYLAAYARALKDKGFRLSYLDAFAGSGWRAVGSAMDGQGSLVPEPEAAAGSALRVLRNAERLNRYVFGDANEDNIASLRTAIAEAKSIDPSLPEPEVHCCDANDLVARECARLRRSSTDRTVMFLDPFGMQVQWATLEQIAATQKVDLWLLVPTGQALIRLLARHGKISSGWERALGDFLGGADWRDRFYAQPSQDLFGTLRQERQATLQDVSRFVVERLKATFGPGTHPTGLSLAHGGSGAEAYLLAFACANPNPAAYNLALKFANHMIRHPRGA